MQIHHGPLSDVERYIESHKQETLEDRRAQYEGYMKALRKFYPITAETRILEVGTGCGWFPIQCTLDGLDCTGLEISPQLIEFAKELGARYGVEPKIMLGNLEDADLGQEAWDIIVASNVFEHVEHWRQGIERIYRALKPGGVLYFESTNKFSLTSGEYPPLPVYGWLPDRLRYALRRKVHGEDIMKLGIDFHQFRHGQLRHAFAQAGFRHIYDRIEITEQEWVSSRFRRIVVRLAKRSRLIKHLALTFADATRFICIK